LLDINSFFNETIWMDINLISAALSCPKRLAIMTWLKQPADYFPPQVHADLEETGVCGAFLTEKLNVAPATASAHLRILVGAGLVTSTRIGKWTYFKRTDATLLAFSAALAKL
jgi:DNA-binding transcriptional ArsR family regulator